MDTIGEMDGWKIYIEFYRLLIRDAVKIEKKKSVELEWSQSRPSVENSTFFLNFDGVP